METYSIPTAPTAFDQFQAVFCDRCAQSATSWNVPSETITELLAYKSRWEPAYAVSVDPNTACPAATAARKAIYTPYKAVITDVMNHYLVNSALVGAGDKQVLGIHAAGSNGFHRNGAPGSFPMLRVLNKDLDQHKLVYQDSGSGAGNGKPAGVAYCEIRYVIGGAPDGPEGLSDYLNVTRSGELIRFDAEARNQSAYYFARWVSAKGEYGPWAPVVSQVIR